jgi:orotate phosphoribosyltransferase
MLGAAARLVIDITHQEDIRYKVVAGSGVPGRALADAVHYIAGDREVAHINDDEKDNDPENGYGVRGTDLAGKKVLLVVDDITHSGGSLVTAAEMIRNGGGEIRHVVTLTDRSQGAASELLSTIGVAHHYLMRFVEAEGILVPA